VESLALSRASGDYYSTMNGAVYDLHVKRQQDPLRGNYEDPAEGIKGHHEMMLTSDMCLVYRKDEEFMKCWRNQDHMKTKDWGGHTGS